MHFSILGAPSSALEHYRAMNIKQVQNDTLSHLILSRASTFSLAATGDLTLASECLESTQIYLSNSQEVYQKFSAHEIELFILLSIRLVISSCARLLQRNILKYVYLTYPSSKFNWVHQIPEFIEFEERLDSSLQRDTVKMEHLRMRLTHEPISSDIIDMELIELKFIFDRSELHYFVCC